MNHDGKDQKMNGKIESLTTAHAANFSKPMKQNEKQKETIPTIKHPPTPLSWEEARMHLMNDVSKCYSEVHDRSRAQFHTMMTFNHFLRTNIDMLMAFFCSSLLFLLALLSYHTQHYDKVTNIPTTYNNVEELTKRYYRPSHENESLYIGQMIAGVVTMILSLVSITMSWQRIKISESNKDVGLEGTLKSFASFLNDLSSSSSPSSSSSSSLSSFNPNPTSNNISPEKSDNNFNFQKSPIQLPGTSLTDIYPIYRRMTSKPSSHQTLNNAKLNIKEKAVEGEWHRIPKLLLVKGDYIALQVGDTTPAKVQLLEPFMEARSNSNKYDNPINNGKDDEHDHATISNLNSDSKLSTHTNTLEGGVRITLEMMQQLIQSKQSISQNNRPSRSNTSSDILSSLLNLKKTNNVKKFYNNVGRTELGEESTQLISCNNGMTLFLLEGTPMINFLDKIQSKFEVIQLPTFSSEEIYQINISVYDQKKFSSWLF